jgi:hypothetical protein
MTFKVYLTAEQWEKICKSDRDVAVEVVKQQPELALQLGLELKQIQQVRKIEKPAEKPEKASEKPPEKPSK